MRKVEFNWKSYEEALLPYSEFSNSKKPCWPKNVVHVDTKKRQNRTESMGIPEVTSLAPPYLSFCKKYFEQDCTKTVEFYHQPESKRQLIPEPEPQDEPFELDSREVQSQKATLVMFPEKDMQNLLQREEQRYNLYSVAFFPEPCVLPDLNKIPIEPFGNAERMRLLINVKEISFSLGLCEPFFCSLSIYDIQEKRRVTEEFHFHLNTPEQIALVTGSGYESKMPSRCLFQFPNQNLESLYLVLNVCKVLKGDLEQHVEYYGKSGDKSKKLATFTEEVHDSCKRLGPYRQNFGWSAVQLFNSNGSLHVSPNFGLQIVLITKTADVIGFLQEILQKRFKPKELGKAKFEIRQIFPEEALDGCIDPSGNKVLPTVENNLDTIREMECLSRDPIPRPHTSFVNNVHVTPIEVSLGRRGAKARTIIVEAKILSSDTDIDAPGILSVYNPWKTQTTMAMSGMTSAWFQCRKTKILDEIKFRLPYELKMTHHIVFTVYHVNVKYGLKKVKEKEKEKKEVKSVLGYAFMPIFKDGRIPDNKLYDLRLMNKPQSGYLTADEEAFEYLDEKAILSMDLFFNSSIYSQSQPLSSLLLLPPSRFGLDGLGVLEKLSESLDPTEIVKFFPMMVNAIIKIMVMDNEEIAFNCFSLLVQTIDIVSEMAAEGSWESYVYHIFDPEPFPSLPLIFLKYWVQIIRKNSAQMKNSLRYFQSLVFMLEKSMVLKLNADNSLNNDATRSNRFSDLVPYLSELIERISRIIQEYLFLEGFDSELAKLLNVNLAHFITDLFIIMDRGVVFELIHKIMHEYDKFEVDGKTPLGRLSLQLVFMRVIGHSNLYVILNDPTEIPVRNVSSVKEDFWKKHFLSGTLLNIVDECFMLKSADAAIMACNTLSSIIYLHDNDARFQDKDSRQAIATFYFPFVVMVIDQWNHLSALQMDKDSWLILYLIFAYVVKGVSPQLLHEWWEKETERRISIFFQLIRKLYSSFQYTGERPARALRTQQCAELLVQAHCTKPQLFLQSKIQQQQLQQQPQQILSSQQQQQLLRKKIGLFKRGGEDLTDPRPPNYIVADPIVEFYGQKWKRLQPTMKSLDADKQVILEKTFTKEISLVVLDTCLNFIVKFSHVLEERTELFEEVFGVLVGLFKRNQSVVFLSSLFEAVYHLVPNFGNVLWREKNSICGDLIYEILRHLNRKFKQTRSEALTLYISMAEYNFAEVENFSRTKLQSSIAATKLAGEVMEGDHSFDLLLDSFRSATYHFSTYTEKDSSGVPLSKQMQTLEGQIRDVIKDSEKIKQFSYDPEMISNLYNKISRNLIDSPDERIAWLENLAAYHKEKNNLEEFAQAKIITAALIQEYLTLLNRWGAKLPAAFSLVCPNIDSVLSLPEQHTLSGLEDEICQSALFNHEGFVNLLKEAIDMLKQGGFYESCVAAYQMMLPIFQQSSDYAKQHACHVDLVDLTKKLMDETEMKQRIFSNYYRVAFFGEILNEMNGKEFVYKELNTVLLTQFTDRILAQFVTKFGKENVIKLGNQPVNPSELETTKCYIQIGTVEPYLGDDESGGTRITDWSRAFNLSQFLMDQPFTKSGGTHGTHEDQWIRRTIFTTAKAFPFLEKRVDVISKEITELSPIENAIELIRGKTTSLASELNSKNARTKVLQRDLQGTLLTQVNAGPLAIADTFLKPEDADKYPEELRKNLADHLIKFARTIKAAVSMNNRLIGQEQLDLQNALNEALGKFNAALERHAIISQRKSELQQERESIEASKRAAASLTLGEAAKPSAQKTLKPKPSQRPLQRPQSFSPAGGISGFGSVTISSSPYQERPRLGALQMGAKDGRNTLPSSVISSTMTSTTSTTTTPAHPIGIQRRISNKRLSTKISKVHIDSSGNNSIDSNSGKSNNTSSNNDSNNKNNNISNNTDNSNKNVASNVVESNPVRNSGNFSNNNNNSNTSNNNNNKFSVEISAGNESPAENRRDSQKVTEISTGSPEENPRESRKFPENLNAQSEDVIKIKKQSVERISTIPQEENPRASRRDMPVLTRVTDAAIDEILGAESYELLELNLKKEEEQEQRKQEKLKKQQEEDEARKKILQDAEETTKQILEERKRKEIVVGGNSSVTASPPASIGTSPSPPIGTGNSPVKAALASISGANNTSTPPAGAPGTAGQPDRLARARAGIVSALKEIHTNLNRLVTTATSTTNLQEIMAQVKSLKAVKAELQKASEVVTLKTHQYSAPQISGDKLSQIYALLTQESQMISNLLSDIEDGLSLIEQPTQLVLLVKLCKSVLGLVTGV